MHDQVLERRERQPRQPLELVTPDGVDDLEGARQQQPDVMALPSAANPAAVIAALRVIVMSPPESLLM